MLKIIYNNAACPGSFKYIASRTANRIQSYFQNRGRDADVSSYKKGMEVELLEKHGVDLCSPENGELCWLVVFDDQNKGKFISYDSTETEAVSMQDIAGMFKSRTERRLELQYLLARMESQELSVAEERLF